MTFSLVTPPCLVPRILSDGPAHPERMNPEDWDLAGG